MIVSAAICPSPPLLARQLTGQAEPLPELRAACAAALAALYTGPQYHDLVVFSLLVIVLVLRPQGLFGRRLT